ncbi:MAG: WD40 repeat domain-containing protein [Methanosarcina thermophila]|jgi:WD40 repeat protein|uniref:Outer membrane protein assembly factor BamB, contains PQQ-like beta-propeller repeat n=3 Tax=Methanosarcina thermophila TaxID=2210 RepID=A0A1I7ARC4_METTE|nr:WD40 repeat domain-containing protein [Methanosarcina thermophila]ALK04393.1 MAG: dehydrogenase [Methanosarcina sp. 795]AKB13010.1 PQQ enzyme repeat domain protein [Methanosarcina thermophila TM-1]AKB16359.1 PQQ enzyme repeat domain protein [Methanosarcina thermophila CHTI-55]NLU56495.1 WD40 repeat domain-containing protein [Methanosarcina thermophila]SFT77501.1 Outer membrane protein assembly factor BamB, contains PQQ-like beta-propeller repeat [Methanosarcina thermophila]
MKWKSLIVLLIVILVASGCAEKSQESNNNTLIESSDSGMQETREISSSAEGVPIDSIVFSRAGALLTLQSATELSEIRVYSGEEQIASQKVGETEGNIFASFDWNPKSQYRFEVITGSGESSTIEAYAPSKPALKEEYTIELEDVTPGNIEKTNANIRGVTKFSPNSKYLAIGTHGGSLKLFEVATGEKLWEKQLVEGIADARIADIEFSKDGKRLFVGEESPDAFLYCFDVNGTEIWKFGVGTDLGSDLDHMPATKKIKLDSEGNIYVAASRACGYIGEKYKYLGRVYSFDSEGNMRWKFPESELMDSGVAWIDATPDGKYAVFGTTSFTKADKWKEGTVHVLNGNTGQEHWNYHIQPLEPFFDYSAIWYSTQITPDGEKLITMTSDGRAFLFNNSEIIETGTPEIAWEKKISTPIIVSGVPIYGSANYAYIVNDTLIFSIGSTFSKDKNKDAPFEHPSGNTIFAYDYDGNLLWKWRVDGYAGECALNDRYLVIPLAQNLVTEDRSGHGVYVFDVSERGGASSRLIQTYNTEGITVSADISPDGRYIAALEAPSRLEDGTVLGEYKVHILT